MSGALTVDIFRDFSTGSEIVKIGILNLGCFGVKSGRLFEVLGFVNLSLLVTS